MKFYITFFVALSALLYADNSQMADILSPSEGVNYIRDNKAIVSAFYEAIQKNDEEALKQTLASKYTVIDASSPFKSNYSKHDAMDKNLSKRLKALHRALPDLSIHYDDMIVEGNNVFARVAISGLQKGEFLGIAPTNKPVTIKIFAIFTIENGHITTIQEMWNELSVMKQIGYIAL